MTTNATRKQPQAERPPLMTPLTAAAGIGILVLTAALLRGGLHASQAEKDAAFTLKQLKATGQKYPGTYISTADAEFYHSPTQIIDSDTGASSNRDTNATQLLKNGMTLTMHDPVVVTSVDGKEKYVLAVVPHEGAHGPADVPSKLGVLATQAELIPLDDFIPGKDAVGEPQKLSNNHVPDPAHYEAVNL